MTVLLDQYHLMEIAKGDIIFSGLPSHLAVFMDAFFIVILAPENVHQIAPFYVSIFENLPTPETPLHCLVSPHNRPTCMTMPTFPESPPSTLVNVYR